MVSREKLYDAFGELIYAIANADGVIQNEELEALHQHLENYPGAKAVQWSFDYENSKRHTVEEAYNKALDTCKQNGPDSEYVKLLEVLEAVAASNGVETRQQEIITNFQEELKQRFIQDIEDGKYE